jgi:hypothetical protein
MVLRFLKVKFGIAPRDETIIVLKSASKSILHLKAALDSLLRNFTRLQDLLILNLLTS